VTSVEETLDAAIGSGRGALIGYVPAGFPSVEGSIRVAQAMVKGGVDAVEIGLPYSDPVMDGPTIQVATQRALAGGVRTRDALIVVEAVAADAPTLVMTYWNLVERYGVDAFAADLASAGGAGLITPDLIPEEAEPWLVASDRHDLDRVFLVAPSSTRERLMTTSEVCRGFVYAISVMGVTGARDRTSDAAPELCRRVREVTDKPVGVGLGVSNGAQSAVVAEYADAVIVGSAFVRCMLDATEEDGGIAAVADLAADLAAGVRSKAGVRSEAGSEARMATGGLVDRPIQ
jgi:tryptophan synthase alpha chain